MEPWIISLSLIPSVLRYQFGGKIDLIHAHFAFPDGVVANKIAGILGVPYIVTIHGSDINLLDQQPLRVRKQVQSALEQANLTVAVSNALKQKVLELGISEERLTLIPNGVDTRKFYPRDKVERSTKQLLFIGMLRPIKGVDILLQAVAMLVEQAYTNFHLNIVGDGPLRTELVALAKYYNIEKHVTFVGAVKHEDIPDWIRNSDLLVIPSRNEGWPTIINEAFACATPIVSTDVGGISEAIPTRELGILVAKENADQLASAMQLAITKTWNTETLTEHASKYSWKVIAQKLVKNYQRILAM